MSEEVQMKMCLTCEKVFPLSNFYMNGKAPEGYTGVRFRIGNCKKCHNKKRNRYKCNSKYIPKNPDRLTPFQRLPYEVQKDIKYLESVLLPYRKIALKHNINYYTLISWKNKENGLQMIDKKI